MIKMLRVTYQGQLSALIIIHYQNSDYELKPLIMVDTQPIDQPK